MSKLTESEIDANDRGLKYVEMTQAELSEFAVLERNYIDTIRNLQAELRETYEWIYDMEWSSSAPWHPKGYCSYCESTSQEGHESDCELGDFLAKHAGGGADEYR